MALIEGREMFQTIKNSTRFTLLLPEEGVAKAVLYLLPVRRGLASDWVRYTNIERLAQRMKLAVVMPEGVSSDFCNMAYGMKWWDYLTEELPEYLQRVFGLTSERRFCFGAEMGALGAVKLGLICPERFAAAGAVGENFLRVSRYAAGEQSDRDLISIYGELPVSQDILALCDPIRIASACQKSETPLFLRREDEGAPAIAEVCGHPVLWCDAMGAGWDGYGEALKEFLEKVLSREAKA